MEAPRLRVWLLGDFRVEADGRPVPPAAWSRRGAASLVKLLALEPTGALHRERLADLLWPHLDRSAAGANLRKARLFARRALGAPDLLLESAGVVRLAPTWTDVAAFEAAAAAARSGDDPAALDHALDLYRGDLLQTDTYDEWSAPRRDSLRATALALLRESARAWRAAGESGRAIERLERLLVWEPADEEAHRELMRLLAAAGRRDAARRQYDLLRARLSRELGAEPDAATELLHRELLAPRPAVGWRPAPGAAPPTPPDPLVGRAREVEELRAVLTERGSRLVTLTGPPGVGKTRLALAVAAAAAAAFPDGVCWVPLASIEDPSLVAASIARALDASESEAGPIADAARRLRDAQLLLVVDNFEHVLPAAPVLAELLAACPGLTVLATSRAPLRVRGEAVAPVGPLALPGRGQSADRLRSNPAVELFVARAHAADPSFELSDANAPLVARICRRLECMPLALELCAVRASTLPMPRLIEGLGQPLALLSVGPRDVPRRQRTLRDAIAWSHGLLAPSERASFRRLGVFAGGFGVEAAAVLGADPAPLVEHSLLRRQRSAAGDLRFAMLEAVRHFALEELERAGETDETRLRHAAFYADLAERCAAELRGPRQADVMERLRQETDELRGVLSWGFARDAVQPAKELAARVFGALGFYWVVRGQMAEGRRWAASALAAADSLPPSLRARAELAAGTLASAESDHAAAEPLLEAAAAFFRRAGEHREEAEALRYLGLGRQNRVVPGRGQPDLDRAEALFAACGDDWGTSVVRLYRLMGWRARGEEPARAADAYVGCLEGFRRAGDQRLIAVTRIYLGHALLWIGDLERAERAFDDALPVLRDLRDLPGTARGIGGKGLVAHRRGDAALAERLLSEHLELVRWTGHRVGTAFALHNAGVLAYQRGRCADGEELLREGLSEIVAVARVPGRLAPFLEALGAIASRDRPHRAARLFGAADADRRRLTIPVEGLIPLDSGPARADAERALGSSRYAALYRAGAALGFDDALAAANSLFAAGVG